jgi:hypothetical protein
MFQLLLQLEKIVDLAVEDDPNISVLVRKRLVPPGKIDDAQPAVPKIDERTFLTEGTNIVSGIIRSSMRENVTPALEDPDLGNGGSTLRKKSDDAAHERLSDNLFDVIGWFSHGFVISPRQDLRQKTHENGEKAQHEEKDAQKGERSQNERDSLQEFQVKCVHP